MDLKGNYVVSGDPWSCLFLYFPQSSRFALLDLVFTKGKDKNVCYLCFGNGLFFLRGKNVIGILILLSFLNYWRYM